MKIPDTTYRDAANDLIGEHLRAGHTVRFTITTGSMLPLLVPGDVVYVQPMCAQTVQVGDILVRPIKHVWLAHRLIECPSDAVWITKGDSQLGTDPAYRPAQTEGVVIASEHAGRTRYRRLARTHWLDRMLAAYSRAYARASSRFARRTWRGALLLTAFLARWIFR